MKKATVTLMACALAASSCYAVPAFAAESAEENIEIIEPVEEGIAQDDVSSYASQYFLNKEANIIPLGNGRMSAEVIINCSYNVKNISIKRVVLQEYDGSYWNNIKTFTNKDYPKFNVNGKNLNTEFKIQGIPDATYRLKINAYASTGSSGESADFYSNSQKV